MATDPNDPFGDLSIGDPVEPYKDFESTPVAKAATDLLDDKGSPYKYVAPDVDPYILSTSATTFGGVRDVLKGDDNGLFGTGGSSVLHRDTGAPITEHDVADVKKNPQNYVDNPEYYAAVPKWWYDKGVVKPGQPFYVKNPDTGKSVQVIARDYGPGNGPLARRAGIDLSPAALADLYDGKNPGKAEVVFDFKQFVTPPEQKQLAHAGTPENPVSPDELATGAEIRNRITGVPQRALVAGELTDASIENADETQQVAYDSSSHTGESVAYPTNDQSILKRGVKKNGRVEFPDGSYYDGRAYYYKGPGDTWFGYTPGRAPFKVGSAKSTPDKAEEAAAVTAARKGILRSNYATGSAGDKAYNEARNELLQGGKPEEKLLREVSAVDVGDSKGEDVLNKIPAEIKGDIKALSEYRYPKLSGFALRSPYYQKLLSIVGAYNPAFDIKQYDSRQKTLNAFAAGKEAGDLRSLNTVIGHLGSSLDAFQDMGNVRFPAVNSIKNFALEKSGFASPAKFKTAADTAGTEIARALTGGVPAQTDVKHWQERLSSASSPAQFQGVVQEAVDLLGSRINAYRDQYKKAMGTEPPFSLLNQRAQDVLKKAGGEKSQQLLKEYGGKPETIDDIKPVAMEEKKSPPSMDDAYQEAHRVASDPNATEEDRQQAEAAMVTLGNLGYEAPTGQ